jgi:hypothetical protein
VCSKSCLIAATRRSPNSHKEEEEEEEEGDGWLEVQPRAHPLRFQLSRISDTELFWIPTDSIVGEVVWRRLS